MFFCLINHVSSCVSPIFMTVFFFHVFIILPNFSHPFSSFRYCLKGVCTFHHYHFLIIFHHIAMFLLLFSYFIIFSSSLIISSLFSTWFCDRPHFSHQLSASCQCHWHSFIIVHHTSHIFFILTLFLFFIAFHHFTHNTSSFCHCFWMCCSSRFIIFLNNFHHRAMVFLHSSYHMSCKDLIIFMFWSSIWSCRYCFLYGFRFPKSSGQANFYLLDYIVFSNY